MSVLSSFSLSVKDEDSDLTLLYCIPKLHKCPYKQRYMMTGAAKCSTKPISEILTSIVLQLSKRVSRNIMISAFIEVALINCGY